MPQTITKEPLYIFLHIVKCAGTTIKKHILENSTKHEVLLLYANKPPYLKREEIEKYIKSLTKEQRDKIKVIIGHKVYYGIHKLFPNRDVRYITFLRNPVNRMISHYNYQRTRLEAKTTPKKIIERLTKQLMKNGEILNFEKWFLSKGVPQEKFMIKNLFRYLFDKRTRRKNIKEINERNLKKILNKFYFVGIAENPKDFLFLYHELGINKFFLDVNVSKKYFIPKDYEKTKGFVLAESKYDKELYECALRLNKEFKMEHENFDRKVMDIEIKRKKYYKKISSRLISLKYKILQLIYKVSAKLKKRSKPYTKFLDLIKRSR